MNRGNWKKHLVLTSLVISGLVLTGCSDLSIDPSTSSSSSSESSSTKTTNNKSKKTSDSSDNSNQEETYSNKWTSGFPDKYAGYYASYVDAFGEKNVYSPVVFTGKAMSYGLGDTMIFDDPEYKQIDDHTFIIHGIDNHYNGEHPNVYAKVTFKQKDGTTYLGLVDGDGRATDDSINSYKKTYNHKLTHMSWYKKDTKAHFNKKMHITNDGSNSSDNSDDSDDSNDDMKYTITSNEGKKYKSNYTIQQMRDKYNLKESKTTVNGFKKVTNYYDGGIIEDPLIHDGSPEETHASGSLQLSGNWAIFTNKLYDGGNATDNILINLETGEKEEDIA